MKTALAILCLAFAGCANLTPAQKTALRSDGKAVVRAVVEGAINAALSRLDK